MYCAASLVHPVAIPSCLAEKRFRQTPGDRQNLRRSRQRCCKGAGASVAFQNDRPTGLHPLRTRPRPLRRMHRGAGTHIAVWRALRYLGRTHRPTPTRHRHRPRPSTTLARDSARAAVRCSSDEKHPFARKWAATSLAPARIGASPTAST